MAVILGRKPGGSGGGGGGAPTGPAGGDLSGTYPNPALSVAKQAELDGKVPKSLYDANTVLAANSDDTPAAITMGASTVLARLAAGNIKAASVAEIQALIGGCYLIQEISVGAGGAATIDFTSIPGTYRHLELWGRAKNEAAANEDLCLRFNNDSGGNYFATVIRSIGPTAGGATVSAVTSANIASIPQTGDAAECTFTLKIPYYATGTATRQGVCNYVLSNASGTTSGQFAIIWTGTGAVTRITLLLSGGSDIKQGGIFSLYGVY